MIDIQDALLMRAEFCGGFSNRPEYPVAYVEVFNSMESVIGVKLHYYCDGAEAAMWQSLLTREVLISGGLYAEA